MAATLIDNVFTNANLKILDSSILTCDISDHLPVLVWMNFASIPQCSKAPNYTRRINDDLIEHFGMILSQMDWSEVSVDSEANDPNLAYALFYDLFKNAYDRVFPIKQTSERKHNAPRQPWMTCGLLKSCKKNVKLYLKYIKNPNSEHKEKFTRYRNKFTQIRIRAKQMHYAAEFSKCSHDLKKLGVSSVPCYIEFITVNGSRINDADLMAEKFNAYFTNIGQSLAERIVTDKDSFRTFLEAPPPNSFIVQPTSPAEIVTLGRSIRPTHSPGPDDIDPCVANASLQHLAVPLAEIINCSFSTGIVPEALKIAKVVPIFKGGNREDIAISI